MEIWKDIEGYEGLYQVSSKGRVQSYPKNFLKISQSSLQKMKELRQQGKTYEELGRIFDVDSKTAWRALNGKIKVLGRRNETKIRELNECHGYLSIHLCKKGKTKKYLVHRLVAEAFIPNPGNKPQINHIDSNPSNNCVDNLEWVTPSENLKHAFKFGNKSETGSANGNSKLSEQDVLTIRAAHGLGCFTQTEIAEAYNVTQSLIGCIIRRTVWTHI